MAFNALLGRRENARFSVVGDIVGVLEEERVRDCFDAWSDRFDGVLDPDEPEMIVRELLDGGEFDLRSEEHLEPVREMLQGFPRC